MPTYEYQCPDGHRFEKFQKMTEKPRTKCPVCGKTATRKISGGAGLVFKGSGFYITDYGKDGKGPRKPESDSAPSTEAKPGSESKTDKSETKAGSAKPDAAAGKTSSRQTKGKAASE
jgi:putative FmdB family regulatory protein